MWVSFCLLSWCTSVWSSCSYSGPGPRSCSNTPVEPRPAKSSLALLCGWRQGPETQGRESVTLPQDSAHPQSYLTHTVVRARRMSVLSTVKLLLKRYMYVFLVDTRESPTPCQMQEEELSLHNLATRNRKSIPHHHFHHHPKEIAHSQLVSSFISLLVLPPPRRQVKTTT